MGKARFGSHPIDGGQRLISIILLDYPTRLRARIGGKIQSGTKDALIRGVESEQRKRAGLNR